METESPLLVASEATVTTLSVSVRTLNVGRKQVTLSMFRQMKQENILDPATLEMRGTAWGHVNYFWEGCGAGGKHLHIVWQKGDEIRRACVCPPDRQVYDVAALEAYAEAWAYLKIINGEWPKNSSMGGLELSLDGIETHGRVVRDPFRSKDFAVHIGENTVIIPRQLVDAFNPRELDWSKQAREHLPLSQRKRAEDFIVGYGAAEREMRQIIANRIGPDATCDDAEMLIRDFFVSEAELASRWEKNYCALEKTDQLFIAV